MKVTYLILLAICLSFFSEAKSVSQAKQTFIEASKVSSWNHIKDKQSVYSGLSQAPHKYQLNTQFPSSSGKTLYKLTLVKKLLNWHQQHSNGLEVSLAHLNLHVEQLQQLHIKIKLSPENNIITADFKALTKHNSWLTCPKDNAEKFAALLSEQAHFTLILYGKNHGNAKQKTLYAAYPFKLAIDSKQQWHTINITKNDLNFYWQQNYQEETTSATEVAKQKWQGFILVAESGNSKVVRNYIPDDFPKDYTEVFNEFDVSLSDIQITSTP